VENSGLSGNVIENTGSYELKARMLSKRKAGFRIQEAGFRSQEKDLESAPLGPTKVPNCFAPLDNMSGRKG
jgi:hypothetical protein